MRMLHLSLRACAFGLLRLCTDDIDFNIILRAYVRIRARANTIAHELEFEMIVIENETNVLINYYDCVHLRLLFTCHRDHHDLLHDLHHESHRVPDLVQAPRSLCRCSHALWSNCHTNTHLAHSRGQDAQEPRVQQTY